MDILAKIIQVLFFLIIAGLVYEGVAHADGVENHQKAEHSHHVTSYNANNKHWNDSQSSWIAEESKPAKDIKIANAMDVNVVNTPDVNIVSIPGKVTAEQTIEAYVANVLCEDSATSPTTISYCYFDVPSGKVLEIESINGFTWKGNVLYLGVQTSIGSGGSLFATYRIPKTIFPDFNYIYKSNGDVYATDNNIWADANSAGHDLRIIVSTDGITSSNGLAGNCTINGKLHTAAR